jgi:hypothetical protein
LTLLALAAFAPHAFAAETFAGRTFYFGDLHAHTGVSPDGGSSDLMNCMEPTVCGALADVFTIAQANGLDFVSFTDHSTSATATFNDFLADVLAATTDTFVTIPGVELILEYSGGGDVGHKNTYVFQDDDSLLTGLTKMRLTGTTRPATCSDVWANVAALSADFGPALEFAHHPAAGNIMVADWSCHDQTYQPVVEVYSGWGNSLDFATDYDPLDTPVEDSTVHAALETYGLKVGFVAGTDGHDTRPGSTCTLDTEWPSTHIYGGGLTMVVLDDDAAFERSAIYDEMVARRTLVTTGPAMPVFVQWTTSDGARHSIGEELVVRDGDATALSVRIPMGWEAFVTDVNAVGYSDRFSLRERMPGRWTASIPNGALPSWLYVEVSIDGAAYYGAGVCDDGGADDREFVWSSPAWFEVTNDLDGDGYAYDVDCNDDRARVNPGARDVPGNGVDENCDGVDAGP